MTEIHRLGTTQVYRVFIKAPVEKVWTAITDPEWNQRYGYCVPQQLELHQGGAYRAEASDPMLQHGAPQVILDGEVLECDPPKKLVQTWHPMFMPEMAAERIGRLTYELEEQYGATRLTLTHELEGAPIAARQVAGEEPNAGGGWAYILSDLKTMLETGESFEGHKLPA
jgi:uncharacterized protein YndB with AHSA1/START domain